MPGLPEKGQPGPSLKPVDAYRNELSPFGLIDTRLLVSYLRERTRPLEVAFRASANSATTAYLKLVVPTSSRTYPAELLLPQEITDVVECFNPMAIAMPASRFCGCTMMRERSVSASSCQ